MSGINTDNPAFLTDPSRWSSIIAEWVKSVKEHGGAVIGPVKIPSPSGGSPGGSTPGGGSPSGGEDGGDDDGGGDDGGGEDGGGGGGGGGGDNGSGNSGGSGNDSGGSSGSPSPTSVPSGGGGGSQSGGDDGSSTSPPSGGGGSGGGNVTSTSGDSNNGGSGVNPTSGTSSIPPSGNHNTSIPEGSNHTGDSGASNTAPQDTASTGINHDGHSSSTSQGETATSRSLPLSSPTSTSNLSTTPFTQRTSIPPTDGPSPSTPIVPPGAVSHARARNVNVIAIVLPIAIVILLLVALLAFFLFRRRKLRRQRNGIRFDDNDKPAPRPRGGATTPVDYPAEPVPASGESSFVLRHPFASAYHASSATLDSTSNAQPDQHQFTSGSGSVIGSGNFSFASAHQGHGSTPGVHVADINDPFSDPYNVLRERHRALLANAAMWTPASAMSGSGTSYFGESSTGAVEDASRQDLGPGRSDVHLAPPPPPRSDSPHT